MSIRRDRNRDIDDRVLRDDRERIAEYQVYLYTSGRWYYNDDGSPKLEKFREYGGGKTTLRDPKTM